ncbi:MAG: penicillin acylase family protein [Chloroflexi bacterium]|nr:penicillin acylase family protein [Chloroflexota bacterium]
MRWRVTLGALGALATTGAAAYWRSKRPRASGTLTLPFLHHEVTVRYDRFGTPHLKAKDEEDLFAAIGFVMAQDRLWQMDLFRRAARGQVAEVAGRAALEVDRFHRTLGLGLIADQKVETLDATTLATLQAFCRGVNHFVDHGPTPIECDLLRYRIRPWQPGDCLAIGHMMGYLLGASLETAILAEIVHDRLGSSALAELLPGYPSDAPFVAAGPHHGAEVAARAEGLARDLLDLPGIGGGSNNWVVHASRSASGGALLACDPHLQLGHPGRFYELHFTGGRYDVAGACLVGTPAVLVGRNREIAWGVTNAGPVVCDLYEEEIHPSHNDRYRVGGDWESFAIRKELIPVRGAAPELLEVKTSCHGPIVGEFGGANGRPLALKWVGFESTSEAAAALALNRATGWEDFNEALDGFDLPALNFVYADRQGNVGYRLAGRIPTRPWGGLLPVKGSDGHAEWSGYVPSARLPRTFNPPGGFVATANNRVVDDYFPFPITWLWEPAFRARRLSEVLAEPRRFTVRDCAQLQTDRLSLQARDLVPILIGRLRARLGSRSTAVLDLLAEWDFRLDCDSLGAAVYEALYQCWLERVLGRRLEPDLVRRVLELAERNIGHTPWSLVDGLTKRDGATAVWLTGVDADCLLEEAFDSASNLLEKRLGSNSNGWRWGRLHRLTFEHPLGRLGPLKYLFNTGPFEHGGGNTTPQSAEYLLYRPFDAAMGACYRFVVDLADDQHCWSCVPPGNSGVLASKHYRDQTTRYVEGELRQLAFGSSAVARATVSTLTLAPLKPNQ